MNAEGQVAELQKRFPELGRGAVFDVTGKGERFCELIYPNPYQAGFPLTVTVFDDGSLISFGKVSDVAGEKRLPLDAAICAIDDIIHDRVIFVLQYNNKDAMEHSRLYACEAFAVTDGEGDMKAEYEELIHTLHKPLRGLGRLFSTLKGIFVITDFSGGVHDEITR